MIFVGLFGNHPGQSVGIGNLILAYIVSFRNVILRVKLLIILKPGIKMNDPHVVALLYRVIHDKSVDYSQAEPLVHEGSAFILNVKDNQACFKLKIHYGTEQDARDAIEAYIRDWQSHACLESGPDFFRLEFERAEIIDRNPIPGKKNLSATSKFGGLKSSASLSKFARKYPSLPSAVNFNDPDVNTIYQRYMSYRQGNEPLGTMTYFCLNLIEETMRQQGTFTRHQPKMRPLRKKAASEYNIEESVLDKIGELSSTKGGQNARKAAGIGKDYTEQERAFLEQAIMKIIRRAAQKAHSPGDTFSKITLSGLPKI